MSILAIRSILPTCGLCLHTRSIKTLRDENCHDWFEVSRLRWLFRADNPGLDFKPMRLSRRRGTYVSSLNEVSNIFQDPSFCVGVGDAGLWGVEPGVGWNAGIDRPVQTVFDRRAVLGILLLVFEPMAVGDSVCYILGSSIARTSEALGKDS